MAKRFIVEVPVVLKATVGVWADSEEEAKDKVFEEGFSIEVTDSDNNEDVEVYDWEWEMHNKITQGNVFYGCINEIDVYPDSDYEEED